MFISWRREKVRHVFRDIFLIVWNYFFQAYHSNVEGQANYVVSFDLLELFAESKREFLRFFNN